MRNATKPGGLLTTITSKIDEELGQSILEYSFLIFCLQKYQRVFCSGEGILEKGVNISSIEFQAIAKCDIVLILGKFLTAIGVAKVLCACNLLEISRAAISIKKIASSGGC